MVKIAIIVASAALAGCSTPVDDPTSEITATLEAYSEALAQEDVAGAAAAVLTNGTEFTIFEGSGADIGWVVYRDHHLAPEFAAEHVIFHIYDWSNYLVQVDVNLAFATFDIRMEYEVSGEARERDAHGTAILVQTGDGWRIKHLHTS
jgi:ketosteroid isomerase-like protein